jgi:hypothetical protein
LSSLGGITVSQPENAGDVFSVGFQLSNLLSIAYVVEIHEILLWKVRMLPLINRGWFGTPLKANPGELRNQGKLTMGYGD